MIDASELVDNLVAALQDVEELVLAMGGDADLICAYHDRYPDKVSLDQARYEMKSPGIMVAWTGSSPGGMGGFEAWNHELSLTLRAGCEIEEDDPAGYYELFRLIWNGKKDPDDASEQPIKYKTIHASCNPMNTPTIRRQTDIAGIDYFEILTSFTEIGDD